MPISPTESPRPARKRRNEVGGTSSPSSPSGKKGREGGLSGEVITEAHLPPELAAFGDAMFSRVARLIDARFGAIEGRLLLEENLRPPLRSAAARTGRGGNAKKTFAEVRCP